MDAYTHTLHSDFDGLPHDLTEENLQARIRGNLLMALSNKFGWLVLATGNKSEMSVGYTTLYGDLAGGFAVIKDVPKTLVYRLCEWRNSPAGADGGEETPPHARAPIPASIIARPPTAELRHDQRDEDSLPPYELLDRILQGYIELDHSRERLIADGLPSRRGGPHDPPRRSRRVQAPPGAAGDQGHHARVRSRQAHADHEQIPGVSVVPGWAHPSVRGARGRAVRVVPRRVREHDPGSADPT